MAVSQNGYPANDRSQCTTYIVSNGGKPGGRTMTLRKGSPGELLAHFLRWFDATIRDIDPGIMDDWSYAERPIRGSTTTLSNHASGTAADVDATKWPLGVEPTSYLTPAEIARVRLRLQVYEGCIRWGGDYTGRKDPMHFEINRDQATCDRVWAELRPPPNEAITPATPDILTTEEDPAMILVRNTKGTVVLLGDNFAEWVPTSADHVALTARLGSAVALSDGMFDRVVNAARSASSSAAAIRADLADEEPAKLPATPTSK
jgi:hypothetical protein